MGERWSLLIIREINFGNHRFDLIARNTGAARDIVSRRLHDLEEAGIVFRRQYQDRPVRYEYCLTDAGSDLRGVLNSLRTWGDKWVVKRPPVLVEHSCGHRLAIAPVCANCGQKVDVRDERDWTEQFVARGWDRLGPTASGRDAASRVAE